MKTRSGLAVSLGLVLVCSGCSSTVGGWLSTTPVKVPPPTMQGTERTQEREGATPGTVASACGDLKKMRADRDQFVHEMRRVIETAKKNSSLNQQRFYGWTIGGIVVGLGGAVASSLSNVDSSKQKVAQITAAVGGAIAAVIGLYHFESNAARMGDCAATVHAEVATFDATWSNVGKLADSTVPSESLCNEYGKAKENLAKLLLLESCKGIIKKPGG